MLLHSLLERCHFGLEVQVNGPYIALWDEEPTVHTADCLLTLVLLTLIPPSPPMPISCPASAPPYLTPPHRSYCQHLSPASFPLTPKERHPRRSTANHQWASRDMELCSAHRKTYQEKPPPFSAQWHNFSSPFTPSPYFATAKYWPDLLAQRCAKALLPSLSDLKNSVDSSP